MRANIQKYADEARAKFAECSGPIVGHQPQQRRLYEKEAVIAHRKPAYRLFHVVDVSWEIDKFNIPRVSQFRFREYLRSEYESHPSEHYGVEDMTESARVLPNDVEALRRWDGMRQGGPHHYVENTVYHAGNRDCDGLLEGEARQIRRGGKELCWKLMARYDPRMQLDEKDIPPPGVYHVPLHVLKNTKYDGDTPPDVQWIIEYAPWYRIGKGKERNLKAARNCAYWPDATDEELSVDSEELARKLAERVPTLVEEFKGVIASLGFDW